MIYKTLGKTGIQLSRLGFGAMRLPMNETKKCVDYDKAVPLMQRAFELGVNYVDTAPYYCESDSENAVGMALKGWRDRVYLSTKNPIEDSSGNHWRERLERSLKKLDTGYIDFYHMWGITLECFQNSILAKDGPMDAARRALDEGLIRHVSFSFHDSPENMIPIIDSGIFSSVLCQYNLLDQSNAESIRYAHEKGLGVVIMGPVGGGRLGAPSDVILGMMNGKVESTAEAALRFVLANPHVGVALSGMQNIAQLEENVRVASIEGPLSDSEYAKVQAMERENMRLRDLYCTGCKYCLPCPRDINIPHVFSLMNEHRVYGLTEHAKAEYKNLLVPMEQRTEQWMKARGVAPDACAECGLCESRCPQKLSIIKQLKETRAAIGEI